MKFAKSTQILTSSVCGLAVLQALLDATTPAWAHANWVLLFPQWL